MTALSHTRTPRGVFTGPLGSQAQAGGRLVHRAKQPLLVVGQLHHTGPLSPAQCSPSRQGGGLSRDQATPWSPRPALSSTQQKRPQGKSNAQLSPQAPKQEGSRGSSPKITQQTGKQNRIPCLTVKQHQNSTGMQENRLLHPNLVYSGTQHRSP